MRIKYIDAMRGFTMFLVVFGHTLNYMGVGEGSVLGEMMKTFRMPLFFFVSGYIGYKALNQFTHSASWSKLLRHKAFVQLVPTVIIYCLYQIALGNTPLDFFHRGFYGYWFTLVLFELFAVYYTLSYACRKVGGSKLFDAIFVALMLCSGFVGLWLGHLKDAAPHIVVVLNIQSLFAYLPFFTFGLLARKHEDKVLRFITGEPCFVASVVLFVAGYLLGHTLLTRETCLVANVFLNSFFLRYLGLLIVFNVFYRSADYFASDGRLSRIMQYVGHRTLDIYLLHYFFIAGLERYAACININGGGAKLLYFR